MKTATVTEFREKASELLSNVEGGEVLVILRRGKPIARVSAVSSSDRLTAWKQPALRISSRGGGLSAAIREEREDEELP